MTQRNFFRLFFVGLAFSYLGCDTIPYNEAHETSNVPIDTSNTEMARQVVLLEDYTGHTCGNCPIAHAEAKRLSEKYGDRLVIMSLHIGFYAKPKSSNPDGSYKEDFRTAVGNALEAQFNVEPAGLPKGLINRSRFGGSKISILNSSDWEGKIAQILAEPTKGIKMELTPSYNSGNGNLSVQSKITFQKGYQGQLKAAMYVTEDSIVNWQKIYGNNPEDVQNYLHRHVLRSDMQIEGNNDLLNEGQSMSLNQVITNNWTTQLSVKININRSHVILVLFNPDTAEIVQVGEVKLKTL